MKKMDELDFHLEMLIRRYRESGCSEDDARARALARLGDLAAARAAAQTEMETPMPQSAWWSSLMQDARYALRTLVRTPVFTITALVTIAVGAGATTAIFSVVNTVLLRKLPYPAAERAMTIYDFYYGPGDMGQAAFSPEEFADLGPGTTSFERFAALRPQQSALTDGCTAGSGCEPERVNAYVVSPELFTLLGVAPARGRDFTAADGVAGADRVVLISDRLWKRRFGGDAGLLGRTITLGGLSRTVIGIMPPGINFPDDRVGYLKDRADAWMPVNWQDRKDGRGNQYLVVLATRRPGVSLATAQADLTHLGNDFKSRFPDRYAEPNVHWRLGSSTLRDEMVGDVRTALVVLFGAVSLVLLIACANVANLTIARGATRGRELAVRSALGAGRRRLVQQLLIETLVVTGFGTALGISVAWAGLRMLIAINPGGIPRLDSATIDGSVLAFASLLAVTTGVVVGLLPALRQSRADPQQALADGTRGAQSVAPNRWLRQSLVVAEVALAVVVLIGALLLVRSFDALQTTPTGVDLRGTAIAELTIPRATYDTADKIAAFHRSLTARLAALPGVTSASGVYPLPMSGAGWSGSVSVVGFPEGPGLPEPHAEYAVALPGYFKTVGIAFVAGRDFADTDIAGAESVAIVDEDFARRFWPGTSPIGKRIATNGDLVNGPFQTVIGVVGHTLRDGARNPGEGQLYLAALQKSETTIFFVARTAGDAGTALAGIRSVVHDLDPRLPITRLTTGVDLASRFTAKDRFNVLLFSVFGLVALVLAGVGIYGVLSSLVAQRTREIGIRLALGGRPSGVVRRLVGEGTAVAGVGVALGLATAVVLSRGVDTLLFGITPTDPSTYIAIGLVALGVAMVASYLPARRVTRIDPVETLRN